jgi:sugar phosphate permease
MVAAFLSLALTPAGPNTTHLLWANTAAICGSIFALRGIYYALMEEGDVPVHLTGTAVGVVSIIGYTPDIFAPAVLGWLTDTHPGADGHRMFFALIAVGGVIGLGAALMAARRVRARDAVAVC